MPWEVFLAFLRDLTIFSFWSIKLNRIVKKVSFPHRLSEKKKKRHTLVWTPSVAFPWKVSALLSA